MDDEFGTTNFVYNMKMLINIDNVINGTISVIIVMEYWCYCEVHF